MTTPPPQEPTSQTDTPAPESKLRQLFDRSFELEMLISGAIIFLLFGLTQKIDDGIEAWRELYATQNSKTSVVTLVMGRGVIYVVLTSLILHLVLRSFWVGLVGLTSVFPGGVKPENAQGGPFLKSFVARNSNSLFELSNNIDKWCRLIYSIAFIMLLQFGGVILVIVLTGLVSVPISKYFFPGWDPYWVGLMLFSILLLPTLLANLADRLIGRWGVLAGLRNNTMLHRVFHAVFQYQKVIALQGLIGTVAYTIYTNITRRQLIVGAAIILLMLYFFMFQGLGLFDLNHNMFTPPRENLSRVQSAHYENLNEKPQPFTPTIQADMIHDEYVRLFLPIDTRFADSLLTRYPQLTPAREVGIVIFSIPTKLNEAQVQQNMQTLTQVFKVYLNDSLQQHLVYSYYLHPKTKVEGLLAYLPTHALPKGRNILRVTAHYTHAPVNYSIPFYR